MDFREVIDRQLKDHSSYFHSQDITQTTTPGASGFIR